MDSKEQAARALIAKAKSVTAGLRTPKLLALRKAVDAWNEKYDVKPTTRIFKRRSPGKKMEEVADGGGGCPGCFFGQWRAPDGRNHGYVCCLDHVDEDGNCHYSCANW